MKVRNRDEDKIEREYGHWRPDKSLSVKNARRFH